jgi:hypothetical protein
MGVRGLHVGMHGSSLDLRQQLRRACEQRLGSQRAMATLFGVRQAGVTPRLRRRRTTGALRPRPHAGGRRAIGDATACAPLRWLGQAHPEAQRAEVSAPRQAPHGRHVRVPPLGRLVLHLKLPRQHRRARPMRATPHSARRRALPERPRASTAPCPVGRAGHPAGSGSSGPSRSTMGRPCPCGRPWRTPSHQHGRPSPPRRPTAGAARVVLPYSDLRTAITSAGVPKVDGISLLIHDFTLLCDVRHKVSGCDMHGENGYRFKR